MLTQAHLAPLTEENLKKHHSETTSKRVPLKRSKSGKSLRSAGDGESIEFVSDETLKESLNEQKGNEKETLSPVELPSDSTTTVSLQTMNEPTETNPVPNSPPTGVETTSKAGSNPVLNEKEESSEENEDIEPSNQEQGDGSHDSENSGESEIEHSGVEEESDGSSSSSLGSDSDVAVPAKANKNDKEDAEDSNDTAATSRSSSPVVSNDDDDDYDDDDDDDDSVDDDDEGEEGVEEGMKSEDELTHYTSSLNASVSSIPTLYDDREESLESPDTSAEAEPPDVTSGQSNQQGVQMGQDMEAATQGMTEGDKAKVEEVEEVCMKEEQEHLEEEPADGDYTPPGSRQVSGRSATPKTVVVSEFDDVESTIFDRREESAPGSSSRNKLTTSPNSGKSDVSIKNWAGFGHDYVTSNAEGVTEVANDHVKAKNDKRLKTRKMRNVNEANRVKTKTPREKELKKLPASKKTVKKTDNLHILKPRLERQSSTSSGNTVTANKQQKKIVRRKRRPVKQVSFDTAKPTKVITSDSAFFGSRTESRGEGHSSPKPPESEHSDRTSSRWSAVETERASTSSPRPVSSASTAQFTRSSVSIRQRSRQTSLVEEVIAVNYPPKVQGKKAQLPSLLHRRHDTSTVQRPIKRMPATQTFKRHFTGLLVLTLLGWLQLG